MLSKKLSICWYLILFSVVITFISGCSDELSSILDEDQTEYDSRRILSDASSIDKDDNILTDAPDVYVRPSKILETTEGFKIFYFAKNKEPKDLVGLIKAQMGVKAISAATGTNQLIINCDNKDQANEVISYIEKVDVPAIQVKIECMVVENYADFTMDRETKVKVGELFGDDNLIITGPDDGWGFFPGASLREAKRGTYGMSIGYSSADVSFLIDMLSSRGYLKVMMNPIVTTAANKPAKILSKDYVPIVEIVTGKDILPYNKTVYIWVEDSLTITPTVYADGSIGLAGNIKFSSKNTPEGVVQNRIITERSVDLKETRVPVGNSLIIGGFQKSEKFSVIRGFPFLKDLPLIGFMFSSKDFEERAKEITFIITPSIASKGIDFNDMVDTVQEMHRTHSSTESITDKLTGIVTDPFSEGKYREKMEEMAATETIERMKAEVEAAKTDREVQQAKQRLVEFEAKLKAGAEAKKKAQSAAKSYSEKVKQLEEAKKKLQEAQKATQEKSTAQIQAAKAEYDKFVKETETLKKEFEKYQAEVDKNTAQLKESTAQINKLLETKAAIEAEKKRLQQKKAEVEKAVEEAKAKQAAREKAAKEKAEREAAEAAAAKAKAEAAAKEAESQQVEADKQENVESAAPSEQPAEESSAETGGQEVEEPAVSQTDTEGSVETNKAEDVKSAG
ncbi:MAG: hypothetical protein ACIAQZ_06530 [Sedimentisphaeraceae bacterium JB056]